MIPSGRLRRCLGSGRRPTWPRALGVATLLAASLAASGLAGAQTAEDLLEDSKRRATDTERELGALLDRYQEERAEVVAARADLRRAERTARIMAQRLIELRVAAIETARKLYEAGPNPDLQMLVSTRKLSHFQGRITYIESAHEAYLETFDRVRMQRRLFSERLGELQQKHASIERGYDQIASIKRQLEAQLESQRGEVAELSNVVEHQRVAAVIEQPSPEPLPPNPNPNGWHANWDAIAQCESGGNWHLDSTYDGGLQFAPDTWIAYGGGKYASYAWQASRLEQIAIAEKVLASQGPSAWPNCFVSA